MNKKLIIIAVIVVLLISVIGIAVFSFEDEEPELEFEPESISIPEPEQAVSELETPASTFAPAPQAEVPAAQAAKAAKKRDILPKITSNEQCTKAGGNSYNYCQSSGIHYCCGVCNGQATCGSNSGLRGCACESTPSRKCKSNAQCNKGWWCDNGICVEGCYSNTDSRNPATGKCLWNNGNIPIGQQCNRNIHSDCESNYCLNSHCVAPKKYNYTPDGCYNDRANPRALPHFLGHAGTTTDFVHAANYCAKKTKDAGYKYFGLQYPPGGTECWAGNNFAHAKKYGQATCGLGGAAYKNYLYTLTNP